MSTLYGWLDLALYYTKCLGVFHRWVRPSRDPARSAMRVVDCRYERICTRCGVMSGGE